MQPFVIAIVDSNVLAAVGLQHFLEDIIPFAEVRIFTSFESLQQSEHEHFVHFFVASRIYFEHTQFFRERNQRSMVLVNGDMQINGVLTLNVCQSEQQVIKSLLGLHSMGHTSHSHSSVTASDGMPKEIPHGPMNQAMQSQEMQPQVAYQAMEPQEANQSLLSAREVEVARLLSKGLINKEVADALNISLTTVISHRKNIMTKLHARSLADIIIYSVVNGLIDVGEL